MTANCSSAFDPDDLELMTSLFDEAWTTVAPDFAATETATAEAARSALAKIVFELARLRQLSRDQLKLTAVRNFRQRQTAPLPA